MWSVGCLGVAVVTWLVATASCQKGEPWWRTATFYEVYPRSFKDSDGDGTGDIKGILEKVDHFKDIGVDAVWLGPINSSPMKDLGYDISDFKDIDPIFGTMEDYETLLFTLKNLGIKLILDFVPNHTSDKHLWFQISSDPSHPLYNDYKDFYVWIDPKGYTPNGEPIVPNKWVCLFGGSPWKWNPKRKQFYLHHFLEEQPDLNFVNPYVVGNMTDILDFWIEKGIDGFRIDAIDHLFEHPELLDEPLFDGIPSTTEYIWWNVNHTSMINQPETFKLLEDWAEHLYKRGKEKGRHLGMFLEVYTDFDTTMKYYGTGNHSLKIPFNFFLLLIKSSFLYSESYFAKATDIKQVIDNWMKSMPRGSAPNWVVSNHDSKRIPNRYGPAMIDTINILTAVLPGVQVVYNGDEIGMEDTPVNFEQLADPWPKRKGREQYTGYTRDLSRSPMQWDNSLNAGFSNSTKTWLPVNQNYWRTNVATEKATPVSHLNVFKAAVKARKDEVLKKGDLRVVAPNDDTLIVVRSYNGSYYLHISNIGIRAATFTSRNLLVGQQLDMDLKVVTSSVHSGVPQGTFFQKGAFNVSLKPKASILLKSSSSAGVIQYSIVVLASCMIFLLW